MSGPNRLSTFARKDYRDGYLQSTVRAGVAYQIQALRTKFDDSQVAFAERIGKKQSTVSRLEDTEYGRVSVQTLLDIASALDVALIVRFVDYPTFFSFADRMAERQLQPDTIFESVEEASKPTKNQALEMLSARNRYDQPGSFRRGSVTDILSKALPPPLRPGIRSFLEGMH